MSDRMKLDCVILAAGASSRMGRNKMTLDIGGKTVLERCMGAFYDACSRIIVVTGSSHADIQRCLTPYPKAQAVYCADHRQGMFRSIKEGIRHVRAERFFLTPGDYPLLQADTVRRIGASSGPFVAPVYGDRQGHPVLLDRSLIPDILNAGCPSLRDYLRGIPEKREQVFVDDIGVVTDIDTMEEYKLAVRRYGARLAEKQTRFCAHITGKTVQNKW